VASRPVPNLKKLPPCSTLRWGARPRSSSKSDRIDHIVTAVAGRIGVGAVESQNRRAKGRRSVPEV